MGTIFRITHVQMMSDQIECIHLKITDEQLSIMTEHLRKTIQLKQIDLKLSLATLLLQIGQHSKAAEFYQMQLQSEKQWSNRARILMNISVVAAHLYAHNKVLIYYQQALDIFHHEGKVSNDDFILAEIYINMDTTYRQNGDKELALQYYRRSLDLQLSKPETNYNQPLFIRTLDNIAHLLQEQGLYDEALLRYNELLNYMIKTLPSIDPYIGRIQKRIS
ncbi:unnamed protein product [Rotaria sp. Silwood2]|nr:unnamed protein product [Rotaria sp. Silwood2]CAF3396227.1 unnamed protein product [Rotaria sp. Silwood2]CAF4308781.1 unnamed protein product [Rotaria sp. Silwood2]CAF4370347.1 unnamed protein product [Rotaria sp. Silwood2]